MGGSFRDEFARDSPLQRRVERTFGPWSIARSNPRGKAKVGLVALPAKLEPNEWLADQMGQPSAKERKAQGDPERQTGDIDTGPRNGDDRDRPEDD